MRHPTQAGADTQSAGSKAPAPGLVAQPETAKGLKRLSAPDGASPR
jgi:hypothetical protein